MNANLTQVIATLKANAAKTEADIAAIPAHHFVIVWHGCCLKTDGATVALLGKSIYIGTREFMEAECAKWNRITKDDSTAVVMSQPEALAYTQKANAEMLASLPRV